MNTTDLPSSSMTPVEASEGNAPAFPPATGSRLHAYVKGVRRPELETLSPQMWEALYNGCWKGGKGGSNATRDALVKRGLFNGREITPAGIEAMVVIWTDPASANTCDEARAKRVASGALFDGPASD